LQQFLRERTTVLLYTVPILRIEETKDEGSGFLRKTSTELSGLIL